MVVLGRTGRNFAAGMTGGVAYRARPDREFAPRSVTVRAWTSNPLRTRRMSDMLQQLIVRHGELTGSPLAKWILDNWDSMLPRFVKVFPHEYKRALGIPRTAAAAEPLPAKGSQPREVLRG